MNQAVTILTAVLTTVISLLLGLILKRLSAIDAKLDQKVDEKSCRERHEMENKKVNGICREDKEMWEALHKHSHTGLPTDAQVIRR